MLTHICWTSDKCYTSTHLIHLERENRMIFAFKKGTRTLDYIALKVDVKMPTKILLRCSIRWKPSRRLGRLDSCTCLTAGDLLTAPRTAPRPRPGQSTVWRTACSILTSRRWKSPILQPSAYVFLNITAKTYKLLN